jgi:membrane fusion protein, multidrug efflux system
MSRRSLAIAVGGACALTLAGCAARSAPQTASSPPPVRVAAAISRPVPVEVQVVGSVEPYSTIVVKAQVGGILKVVHFKEGDPVRKGDLLFEIEPRPFEQAVRIAEANLARDEAMLRQAEANLSRDVAEERYYHDTAKRYTQLASEGIFSKEQGDQAMTEASARGEAVLADRAAIESARASIEADKAALEKARVDLGYCQIRSPIDGRTGNISVKQGNLVKSIDVELVSINQVQPIYVTFAVPEKFLPEIRSRLTAGKLLVQARQRDSGTGAADGTLTFVDNTVDNATGTIKLKGTFSNEQVKLWPGQFLDVSLRLSELPSAVVIPLAALQNGQIGNYVFVVKGDDTVEIRPVTTGPKLNDQIAIQKGIAPGDRVVTEGQLRLAPGAKVRVLS